MMTTGQRFLGKAVSRLCHRLRAGRAQRRRLNDESGVVLVAVLIGVALLLALSAFGSRSARTELMIARNDMLAQKALAFAEAGLSEAYAALKNKDLSSSSFNTVLAADGIGGELAALGGQVEELEGTKYVFKKFGTRADDGYYVRLRDNFDEAPNNPTADSDQRVVLQSVGHIAGAERVLEMGLRPSSTFEYAMFADIQLTLDSNVYSDSYDSDLAPYCNWPTPFPVQNNCNKGDDPTKCFNKMTNGDVGTNGTADSVLLLESNTKVYGDATVGPGANVDAIENNGIITGTEDSLDEPKDMAPIDAPVPSIGAIDHTGEDWSLTKNKEVVTYQLGAGDHLLPPVLVTVGATLTIQITQDGDVNLFTPSFTAGKDLTIIDAQGFDTNVSIITDVLQTLSNGQLNFIATGNNSTLTFYVNKLVDTDSNFAINNTLQDATRMSIIGTSTLQGANFNFGSNTAYFGTIYAPLADIDLNSQQEIYGAVIGRTIVADSMACVHYDERLGRQAPRCCRIDYWREVRSEGAS
jgi:hypothetical protein